MITGVAAFTTTTVFAAAAPRADEIVLLAGQDERRLVHRLRLLLLGETHDDHGDVGVPGGFCSLRDHLVGSARSGAGDQREQPDRGERVAVVGHLVPGHGGLEHVTIGDGDDP